MERQEDGSINTPTSIRAAELRADKARAENHERARLAAIERLRLEQEADDDPNEVLSWDDPRVRNVPTLNANLF